VFLQVERWLSYKSPIQLENNAKHFVMQRFRLKTMLNSNSMLQRHFSVKVMSFGSLQVQRFLRIQSKR
jgi:hypothetical protein